MASLYVSTYAKYSNGSLAGEWIDLDGHDIETFTEVCRELHNDEADPEFMYQDYDGIPEELYSESSVSNELFDFVELDDDVKQRVAAMLSDNRDIGYALQHIDDVYKIGDTEREAHDYVVDFFLECCGVTDSNPLFNYIDEEAIYRDMQHDMNIVETDDGYFVLND